VNRLIPLVAAATCLFAELHLATAGGMFLPTRGVRPTARGGAFTAGADDPGALWFNPAGLAHLSGGKATQLFLDVGFVRQSVEYTRIDSGLNPQATVDNEAPGLPIPTLAAAFDLGDDVVLGAGIFAPYSSLGRFPESGPQRYSMVDLSQSVVAIAEAAVGWEPMPGLRVGAGVQNMFVRLVSQIVFSGCPGQTVCAPEDPEFDSQSEIDQRDYFAPSGIVGVQYDALDAVTLGAALQLPFRVSGSGSIDVRLPSSGFFDGASVAGDEAAMSFNLPAMARLAVEARPLARWRVELGVDVELWSMHDRLVVEPENVRIEDAPAVGTYEVGDIDVPREFDDSIALKLGVEGQPVGGLPLTVALGYAYETAAAPDAYLSVLTVDGTKQLFGGGLGYALGATRLFASVAFVAVEDREVSPEEGKAPQLTPIRAETQDEPLDVFVNWGSYRSSWLVAGVGAAYEF
jgi:long-chain fatty acid transport protein